MTGQAAEGQGADGNGNFLRIGGAGGPYTVESGQTNYFGNDDTGFAQMPAPPLRTRPAYPNSVPPLQRSVPVLDPAGTERQRPRFDRTSDGSHPNAPAPPLPNDPTRRIP